MKIKIFQADAFADKLFAGNPAAVCPLESWLSDALLQQIAAENNLPETVYFVRKGSGYHIRWFTPKSEVNLCGHATLAAAFILFEQLNYKEDIISFESKSGILTVRKNNGWLTLNFPVDRMERIEITAEHLQCFDKKPLEVYSGINDFMFVFSSQEEIEQLKPDFGIIAGLEKRGVIVTARGKTTDFVSRFFAPADGINEDPVTGSAHTTLMPYWSKQLGKNDMTAKQLSERGGFLRCSLLGDRVEISGQAKLFLAGDIFIEE